MQYKQEPQLQQWLDELIWAPGGRCGMPRRSCSPRIPPATSLLLTTQLAPTMQAVSRELTLISAYFVPTASGVEYCRGSAPVRGDGTHPHNSLEATDVPAVHGGYAPYRRELLEHGVRLFELRRQPQQEPSYSFLGESNPACTARRQCSIRKRYSSAR